MRAHLAALAGRGDILWRESAPRRRSLRLAPVRAAGPGFDPGFGAGTARPIGDEVIFLSDLLRAGPAGRNADVVMAAHPRESSGGAFDRASLIARRAAFRRAPGRWRAPTGWRNRHRFRSLADALRFLVQGRGDCLSRLASELL